MKQFIHSRFPKTVGLVLALSVGMVACGTTSTPTPVEQNAVTGVSISNAAPIELKTGSTNNTAQISVAVTGTGTFNSAVTYSSSNTAVADVNADGLVTAKTVGTATITVTTVEGNKTATIAVNVTAGTTPTPTVDVKFSFRPLTPQAGGPATVPPVPADYTADNGLAFNDTRQYGWVLQGTSTPLDISSRGRVRATPANNVLQQTFIIMAPLNNAGYQPTNEDAAWEHIVPNGSYTVTVSAGDDTSTDSSHSVIVEGTVAIDKFMPNATTKFQEKTVNVNVIDGRLTLSSLDNSNTKINYVTIKSNTAAALGR